MMRTIPKIILVVWLTSLFSPAVSWADGGAPPSPPIGGAKYFESPLIKGGFTVSYGSFSQNAAGEEPTYFIIHVVLEDQKPYVIRKPLTNDSLEICDYESVKMYKLIEKYEGLPYLMRVEKDFNLEGIPVISEIKLKGYNCDDRKKAMLKGSIKIRVLPKSLFNQN